MHVHVEFKVNQEKLTLEAKHGQKKIDWSQTLNQRNIKKYKNLKALKLQAMSKGLRIHYISFWPSLFAWLGIGTVMQDTVVKPSCLINGDWDWPEVAG